MYCKNCGQEIAPGTSFCAKCGTPVAPQQPIQPQQQPPIQPQQPPQPPIQPQQPQPTPQPSPVSPYSVPNGAYAPGGYAAGPQGAPKKKYGWLIAIIVIAAVVIFTLIFALIIYPQFVDKDNSDQTNPGITYDPEEDDAYIDDDTDVFATDPALENYLAILQPQLAEIKEQTKTAGMNLDISARGSSMVYTYTYLNDIGDVSIAKSALELSIGMLEEASKLLITELETAGVNSPSVIYEYVNSDGTMIFSQEFK
jgi:hypothetical protein